MFLFYRKFIHRQWRLPTIRLFCIAVSIACAVTFSISLLSDRLERLFNQQAKEVLAADLVLQSTTKLSHEQLNLIEKFALQKAQTLSFQTMSNANDAFLLSSVKAVSNAYPLRGQLQTSTTLYGQVSATMNGPSTGEVWVEDRVLNELGLGIGEYIEIGQAKFKISRILVYEPDRGGNFYSFTPRIMMHLEDVEKTGVIQPGSRYKERYLFAGEYNEIEKLKLVIEPTLQLNQEFITVESANQALSSTLQRAYQFLNITALIAILLGAVAAALVSYQYANETTYQYAVLRCLGLQGNRMVGSIIMPFVIYTLISIGIGMIVGAAAHILILKSLSELIPDKLPAPGPMPFLIGVLTSLIVVTSFAGPFLYKLIKTPPKLLLKNEDAQGNNLFITSIFMLIGLAALVFTGTQEVLMTFKIIIILCIFIALAYIFTQAFIWWSIKRSKNTRAIKKLSLRMLKANRSMISLQIIAISITFFSLALIATVRDDLLSSWQSKVPDDAPNIFAINLFESDKNKFVSYLEENGLIHSPMYPIVRGRLSAVNNMPIREYASKESERQDESLDRDLSLTWGFELPKDNVIIEGAWHDKNNPPQFNTVSVEEGIAENLDINLGDVLEFTVETQKIQATVTSLRSVEWESFTPNFYMIFYPGSLAGLPTSFIASLRLEGQQRSNIKNLVNTFPSATFFDVDFLLNRIRGIAKQISFAVETILYFSLLASFVIFISIEMILRHHRNYSTAICKAIGANVNLIQKIFRTQFIIIGLIAGVFAYLMNVIISLVMTAYIIEGNYIFNISTFILCIVITPILVLAAGHFSIRRISNVSSRQLLREP